MLKKINASKVKSDEGFSIHITGLEKLKYSENEKSVTIDWTCNQITHKIKIYASDINSWDTPNHTPMLDREKQRMIDNIRSATKMLDGDFEVF